MESSDESIIKAEALSPEEPPEVLFSIQQCKVFSDWLDETMGTRD